MRKFRKCKNSVFSVWVAGSGGGAGSRRGAWVRLRDAAAGVSGGGRGGDSRRGGSAGEVGVGAGVEGEWSREAASVHHGGTELTTNKYEKGLRTGASGGSGDSTSHRGVYSNRSSRSLSRSNSELRAPAISPSN